MTALPEAYFRAEVIEVTAPLVGDATDRPRWRRSRGLPLLGRAGRVVPADGAARSASRRSSCRPSRVSSSTSPTRSRRPGGTACAAGTRERRQLTVDVVVHEHGVATRWAESVRARRPAADLAAARAGHRHRRRLGADPGRPDRHPGRLPDPGEPAHRTSTRTRCSRRPNEAATFTPTSPAELKVCWAYNPSPATIPSPLSAAVRTIELPPGQGYVWMAGEAACARDVRRYFRHELKWRSQHFDIVGYWRPDQEAYQRRYREVEGRVAEVYESGRRAGRRLRGHPGRGVLGDGDPRAVGAGSAGQRPLQPGLASVGRGEAQHPWCGPDRLSHWRIRALLRAYDDACQRRIESRANMSADRSRGCRCRSAGGRSPGRALRRSSRWKVNQRG